jgi:hypothetical protein
MLWQRATPSWPGSRDLFVCAKRAAELKTLRSPKQPQITFQHASVHNVRPIAQWQYENRCSASARGIWRTLDQFKGPSADSFNFCPALSAESDGRLFIVSFLNPAHTQEGETRPLKLVPTVLHRRPWPVEEISKRRLRHDSTGDQLSGGV